MNWTTKCEAHGGIYKKTRLLGLCTLYDDMVPMRYDTVCDMIPSDVYDIELGVFLCQFVCSCVINLCVNLSVHTMLWCDNC